MIKRILYLFFFTIAFISVNAQYEYTKEGEFGLSAGAAHYFGDLNPKSKINRPKFAAGIYYQKQFNSYLALRLSGHYAQVGYSDIYADNEFQKRRNLSFNSSIWEVALQGDFNFFKFMPDDPNYSFTPFVTIGIGMFTYNPYAYLDGRKVYLRLLGTEGQNIGYIGSDGKARKPYSTAAVCFPIGIGIKYNISRGSNLFVQVTHRLTSTDYLDDVSTTYVGSGSPNFPPLPNGTRSDADILQDRSFEKGIPIGVAGKQRGWSKQKDQYIIAEVGISFNLFSRYTCPSSN